MLRKALRLAAERGTARNDDIARDLNMSTKLVRLVLEDLVRRGYLRAVAPGCSSTCECCSLENACGERGKPNVWSITDKGAKLLGKSRVPHRPSGT